WWCLKQKSDKINLQPLSIQTTQAPTENIYYSVLPHLTVSVRSTVIDVPELSLVKQRQNACRHELLICKDKKRILLMVQNPF
uniref:Uncharacterized protein n=1 Tax=Seriola lalandi dorsalis TaxID=1841481 RepID=A0A3B4YSH3_SERLL